MLPFCCCSCDFNTLPSTSPKGELVNLKMTVRVYMHKGHIIFSHIHFRTHFGSRLKHLSLGALTLRLSSIEQRAKTEEEEKNNIVIHCIPATCLTRMMPDPIPQAPGPVPTHPTTSRSARTVPWRPLRPTPLYHYQDEGPCRVTNHIIITRLDPVFLP